jgi:predicted metal-binding membrane protein
MDTERLLLALRLARPAGPRGFCPACYASVAGDAETVRGVEPASDGVTIAIVLAVAAVAWAVTAWLMLGSGMAMGLGSLPSFAMAWTVMMAATMLPSAIPLVYRFARQAEGRRRRHVAVGMLGLVYLAVWLAFGIGCYLAYDVLGMPWRDQAAVCGLALGLASAYGLTPLKRVSQARCRELCALHDPLPFDLVRAGVVAGWRYGLSCLGCSAGLMAAMVLVGMTSLGWTIVLALIVLVYKFAPALTWRADAALAAVLVVVGIVYAVLT